MTFGADRLRTELEGLGLSVTEPQPGFLAVRYAVQVGPLAGDELEIGWNVPADFPASAPSGLLVRPHLLPLGSEGPHPHGGVHGSATGGVLDETWQCWSRPIPDWPTGSRDAFALLAHVRHLFDTLPASLAHA